MGEMSPGTVQVFTTTKQLVYISWAAAVWFGRCKVPYIRRSCGLTRQDLRKMALYSVLCGWFAGAVGGAAGGTKASEARYLPPLQ